MDPIVTQALEKWPNVPHCYGWLGLDARGHWRMRDERAQALGLAGEKIVHTALLDFINRNYTHDARGCWYFQNGPQRVFVKLEAAPFIARTDALHGLSDHTGQPLTAIDKIWLSDSGNLWLSSKGKIAMLDDRDLAQCLSALRIDGGPVTDERLMAWLEAAPAAGELTFLMDEQVLQVARMLQSSAPATFGFVVSPRPDFGNPRPQ